MRLVTRGLGASGANVVTAGLGGAGRAVVIFTPGGGLDESLLMIKRLKRKTQRNARLLMIYFYALVIAENDR